ncbi:MAG: alpha/beta hydrolase fold domain-containing protein [Candidatus Sumerlaeaceae bacterium]
MQNVYRSGVKLLRVASLFVCANLCVLSSAAIRVDKDVVFATVSGEELKLDLYWPENDTTSHAVVLMFHGGGWAAGDKSHHTVVGPLVAEAGYLAISANYRLSPKHKYPAGVQDCQAALKWVRANAAEYRGDARRLALMGESAGGHLSSLLGLWDWTTSGPSQGASDDMKVRAVVNIYGPCDLSAFNGTQFCEDLATNFLGGTTETIPSLYREASPIHLLDQAGVVDKPGPAFLHVHGTADALVPVDQSRRFHARLKELGFDSTLVILEGANHGWKPDSEEGKRAGKAAVEILDRKLKAP